MLKVINKWMYDGLKERKKTNERSNVFRKHAYVILTPLNPTFI